MVAGGRSLTEAMSPVVRPRWSGLPPPRHLAQPQVARAVATICFNHRCNVTEPSSYTMFRLQRCRASGSLEKHARGDELLVDLLA
jgi:hypothetical protein